MILNNKIVLHIPQKALINDTLQDIPCERLMNILTDRLQEAGFHSFYITSVTSFYNGRCYPEKLITIFCDDEYDKAAVIFCEWFTEHNDELRQEKFAYEYNNSLCIKSAKTEHGGKKMYGAVLGDIIGSPYEFDMGDKTTDFPLFSRESQYTDDTIMTLAVAEGIMKGYKDPIKTEAEIINSMQKLGKEYPFAGYGAMFYRWLNTPDPKPYGSFGNGSAMRVSSVGWVYDTLDEVEQYAEISAKVTHDHPEGIKGAKAVAAAIFLARQGKSKADIRSYIEDTYGYSFSRTCDDIRPTYHHVETCQETVPEAMTAFFEGGSFEEVIRLAVSLGGDCDTLTAIAGSIAEAFYPVPEELMQKADDMLDAPLKKLLSDFCNFLQTKSDNY